MNTSKLNVSNQGMVKYTIKVHSLFVDCKCVRDWHCRTQDWVSVYGEVSDRTLDIELTTVAVTYYAGIYLASGHLLC